MIQYHLTDDSHEKLSALIKERLPWLVLGLLGGIVATVLVSKFESILSSNISLAFFLPVIVYMSDAIGTQTENIYVRNLAKFKDNFFKYLIKEVFIGLSFGLFFGLSLALFAKLWLQSDQAAWAVGVAMFINGTFAPVVALIVPEIIYKEHKDPALGAGPFTTIVQNIISLSVYLLVASVIIF
ncbi:magnesium transporter [Candidatus Daviesbacteria bacterium]|nr:magnesium transporter [Candidatus Daviesbacteria bacterium]